jgi:hypothetical protein
MFHGLLRACASPHLEMLWVYLLTKPAKNIKKWLFCFSKPLFYKEIIGIAGVLKFYFI